MKKTKSSVYLKAFRVLQSGKTLTAKQIKTRYGVTNPYQTIYQIRNKIGAAVQSVKTTHKKTTMVRYSLPN